MYKAAGNRTLCAPKPIIIIIIGSKLNSNHKINHQNWLKIKKKIIVKPKMLTHLMDKDKEILKIE